MAAEQLPLFDLPEERKPVPKMATRPRKPIYAKVAPKRRTLCHDCIADIHAQGWLVAPPAVAAKWRRSVPGSSMLLCTRHKEWRAANE